MLELSLSLSLSVCLPIPALSRVYIHIILEYSIFSISILVYITQDFLVLPGPPKSFYLGYLGCREYTLLYVMYISLFFA